MKLDVLKDFRIDLFLEFVDLGFEFARPFLVQFPTQLIHQHGCEALLELYLCLFKLHQILLQTIFDVTANSLHLLLNQKLVVGCPFFQFG